MSSVTQTNKCPHPSCGVMKDREHYACIRHWKSLPGIIQRKILDGYFGRKNQSWAEANKEALAFWRISSAPF